MAFSVKEQIAEWRAKAEANAHRKIGEQNIREAEELQKLRAQRLQLEAQAQRELYREAEQKQIAESRKIIEAGKKEKRAATYKKIGSAVGFVKRAFSPPRPIAKTPASRNKPTSFSVFNPPNIWSGKRVRK